MALNNFRRDGEGAEGERTVDKVILHPREWLFVIYGIFSFNFPSRNEINCFN